MHISKPNPMQSHDSNIKHQSMLKANVPPLPSFSLVLFNCRKKKNPLNIKEGDRESNLALS